jgi:drug/metabolite transporter (DMT)-like permease
MNFYLQLVFAVWLNFIFLGEMLTWAHLVGTFMILVGVYKMSQTSIKPFMVDLKNMFTVRSQK